MEDLKKHVAEVIRQARKYRGLTQKELGTRLGVDEQRINRLESGQTNLTIETLQKILNKLDISITITLKE